MKKIFTLVFALGAATAIFAQGGHGRNESRDVILGQQNRTVYNNPRSNNDYYSIQDRDAQIQRINREYDWRIQSIERDRYLRKAEKKRQIRALQNERDARIIEIRRSYDNRAYRNNNRRY
jgi:hypothetical protein